MIERTFRPFTAEERSRLERMGQLMRDLKSPLWLVDLLIHWFILIAGTFVAATLCIAAPLGGLLVLLCPQSTPRPVLALCLFGPGVIATVCVCWRTLSHAARSEPPFDRDLREGQAEQLHVTASEVVELEEYEDEGSGFFFDVGDGRLLYMQGQYLDDDALNDDSSSEQPAEDGSAAVRTPRFPCREFEIVRASYSQEVLTLRCLGDYLPPSRLMSVEHFEGGLPDWVVFEGRLATLERDVSRVPRE